MLRCPFVLFWQMPISCKPCILRASLDDYQVKDGSGMPDVVAVNNQPCAVQSAALPPPPPPLKSKAESASSLTTVNGQIIGVDGQPLQLWGINWFGFETGTTFLDGLWAGELLESGPQSAAASLYTGLCRICSSRVQDTGLLCLGHRSRTPCLHLDPQEHA